MPNFINHLGSNIVPITKLKDVILLLRKIHIPTHLELPHIPIIYVIILHLCIKYRREGILGKGLLEGSSEDG